MAIKEDLLNPKRRNGPAVPLAVFVLLALVGGAFVLGRLSIDKAPPPPAPAIALGGAAALGGTAGSGPGGAGGSEAELAPPEPKVDAPVLPGAILPGTAGLRRVDVKVEGSLSATLNGLVGQEVGDPLTLVSSRLLVWWMDVARDVRPGDRLEILYELPEGSEPTVHALRFRSGKLDRTLKAYRFHVPGAKFPRYFDEEGREIELRLVDSPIADYEQVTSLLKDGRRHKGVDFKAPVGSPVVAPWAGVVRRKNWNYRANGGSVEIEDAQGRKILFLHLAEVEKGIGPGTRVAKGQRIALSGNTGRSTAPHLHYQVMSPSGKVLDPFDLHRTRRDEISATHRDEFRADAARLDRLLDGVVTPPAAPAAAPVAPAAADATAAE